MPRRDYSYAATWERFARLSRTQDSLADGRRGWRRWLLAPVVAFVIPVDDPAACAELGSWQSALAPWLAYAPQPAERLHITLHIAGRLRPVPWLFLPFYLRRSEVGRLAERARPAFERFAPFEVGIGPLNAFPNALFAEVQDEAGCLRALRAALRRALPLQARPPLRWPFVAHVTLGFWGHLPVAPLVEALGPFRSAVPLPLRVTAAHLTLYHQDNALLRPDVLRTAREEIVAEFRLEA